MEYERVSSGEIRGGGGECAVCMEGLGDGQIVCTLSCDHTYHSSCVFRWLIVYNSSCPTCRQPADLYSVGTEE